MTVEYHKAKSQYELLTEVAENTRANITLNVRPAIVPVSHTDLMNGIIQVRLIYDRVPWDSKTLCFFLRSTLPDGAGNLTLSVGMFVSEPTLSSVHSAHVIPMARAWATELISGPFDRRTIRERKSSWHARDWMTGDGVFHSGSIYDYEVVHESPSNIHTFRRPDFVDEPLRFTIESVGFALGWSTELPKPIPITRDTIEWQRPYPTPPQWSDRPISNPLESTTPGCQRDAPEFSLIGWIIGFLKKLLKRST